MVGPFESGGNENPFMLHEELQETMQNLAGIARTGEELEQGLDQILRLQERAKRMTVSASRLFNPGWHMSVDVPFMLTVLLPAMKMVTPLPETTAPALILKLPCTT